MIQNERQLKITRHWVKQFTASLKEVIKNDAPDIDPLIIQAEANGIRSQLNTFRKEIRQYNRLKIRRNTPIKSMYEIGEALIKARIMSNLTQKELADKLNMKEQQIQRYEDNIYNNAALHTIFDIARELNVSSTGFSISINTTK